LPPFRHSPLIQRLYRAEPNDLTNSSRDAADSQHLQQWYCGPVEWSWEEGVLDGIVTNWVEVRMWNKLKMAFEAKGRRVDVRGRKLQLWKTESDILIQQNLRLRCASEAEQCLRVLRSFQNYLLPSSVASPPALSATSTGGGDKIARAV
jgi:hypothetical protein